MRPRLQNAVFSVTVTAAFVLGLYSLYLAAAHADMAQPANNADLVRTATASDAGKIETALGASGEEDLVYVVLDNPQVGPDPELELAARKAARTLVDSGLAVAVRLLDPGDPDFTAIVAQNGVGRFPAVLLVKQDGGIVLLTDDLNADRLLHAYEAVWGKTSSCDEATSAIY